MLIRTRGDDPGTAGQQGKFETNLANNLPAVILSHGRNGFGATSTFGVARPTATGGTDEEENSGGTLLENEFFSRGYSAENAGCADNNNEGAPLCAFDDIVMWISPALLNNRMVSAGRLP